MNDKLRKIIIWSVAGVVVLGIASLGFWFYISSQNKAISNRLYDLALNEHYALASDLYKCQADKTSADCETDIYTYIDQGILLRLAFVDEANNQNISGSLARAKTASEKADWGSAQTALTEAIGDTDDLLSTYTNRNLNDAKMINKVIVKETNQPAVNYYINASWAVVTVAPTATTGGDPGNILLNKSSGAWSIAAGPDTLFEPGTSTDLGANGITDTHLQEIYGTPLVEFSGLPDTKVLSISTVVNTIRDEGLDTLPLSETLPVSSDKYSITTDFINNKPYYIADIYYFSDAEKNSNKGAVRKWFSDNEQKPEDLPIQYNYIAPANVE